MQNSLYWFICSGNDLIDVLEYVTDVRVLFALVFFDSILEFNFLNLYVRGSVVCVEINLNLLANGLRIRFKNSNASSCIFRDFYYPGGGWIFNRCSCEKIQRN